MGRGGYNKYSINQLNEKGTSINNRLTVLSFGENKVYGSGRSYGTINCICKCGNLVTVLTSNYLKGTTLSCGCYSKEILSKKARKYERSNNDLLCIYYEIINRCYDAQHVNYKYYGAKGVTVCDEWKENFQPFYDWCISNGWQKGLQVDKDIKGNGMLYSPDFCSIVTRKENQNSRSCTIRTSYQGEMRVLSEVADELGVKYNTLYNRMFRNKVQIRSIEESLKILGYKWLSTEDKDKILNSKLGCVKMARELGISKTTVLRIRKNSKK